MSYYMIWTIPIHLVNLIADAGYNYTDSLMKTFDYVWMLTCMSVMTDVLLIALAYYLGIIRKMYFKGVMYANLVYIVNVLFFKLPWLALVLDIEKDMNRIDFDELEY